MTTPRFTIEVHCSDLGDLERVTAALAALGDVPPIGPPEGDDAAEEKPKRKRKTKTKSEKPKKAKAKKPEPEDDEDLFGEDDDEDVEELDADAVKGAIRDAMEEHGSDFVKSTIGGFKKAKGSGAVKKFSELRESDYAAFVEALKEGPDA